MSMAPRLLLSPTIMRARQLAYEIGMGGDGSVMARDGEAEALLRRYETDPEAFGRQRQRHFEEASPEMRRIIGENFDFADAPSHSRVHCATTGDDDDDASTQCSSAAKL